MITQEYLKTRLIYNPDTGIFVWANSSRGGRWDGREAGWKDDLGYLHIRLQKKLIPAHRLAFLFMTGEWPGGIVDHINLNPSDNRWKNLRDGSKQQNQENRHRPSKNNKTGLLGVSPNGRRFTATINTEYKHQYIGTFDTPQEAHEAYVAAKRKIHKGCTI